jgi:hypothetical protein
MQRPTEHPSVRPPPAGRRTWWKRAAVLLALCLLTFILYPLLARLTLGEWTFPFDDPWTHQVYARNLAWYGQYAFNLGEPSTGSSAPLWTFLMVPAHWLGLPPVPWALTWGLLALAGLGAVTWTWAEKRFPAPLPPLLMVATLLTPQIAWSGVEGMETALVAFLALLTLYRLDRPAWPNRWDPLLDGLLNGLLLWLRPEAPLLTLIVFWQRRRAGWRGLLTLSGGFLALAIPYLGFHWAISGQPLPQTVYAKAAYYGATLSLASVGAFLRDLGLTLAPGVWPLVAVLVPLALWRMARQRRWPWGPGLAWAGLTVLAAALRLPVVLHFGRHFVPVLPPLLLACGEALPPLPRLARWGVLVLSGCLLLIGLVIGVSFYGPACQVVLDSQVAMGRWIAANLPPATPIATHDIGAIGYFGQRPIVDTLALITPGLTTVVAGRDEAGLARYLQEHQVHYLASFADQYMKVQAALDAQLVVQRGRMELLYLR